MGFNHSNERTTKQLIPHLPKIPQKLSAQNPSHPNNFAYVWRNCFLVRGRVLIALQINTWNQKSSNLKTRTAALGPLHIEYSRHLEQL